MILGGIQQKVEKLVSIQQLFIRIETNTHFEFLANNTDPNEL
jgi:hypothetical protein